MHEFPGLELPIKCEFYNTEKKHLIEKKILDLHMLFDISQKYINENLKDYMYI